jgi:hypothetical protein
MLESEGIAVVESRVKLDEHLWKPGRVSAVQSKKKRAKSGKKKASTVRHLK